MNELVVIDCLIAIIVTVFALVALREPKAPSRKSEIKSAVAYLVVALLLVLPLLTSKCTN